MLPLRIAGRYLFSKKSTNAINIVSGVSMAGMGVGAFALVVVMSVFNGFEGLVVDLYNSFYPDLEITAAAGKVFDDSRELRETITTTLPKSLIAGSLEEQAYFKYVEKGTVATLKGIDQNYDAVCGLRQQIKAGLFQLQDSDFSYAILGANIFAALNADVERSLYPLQVTVPKKGVRNALLPEDAFTQRDLLPSGVFSIQQEFDSKYVFTSLQFAQEISGNEGSVSSYAVKLPPDNDRDAAKVKLQQMLGNDFVVRTRYEQKQSVYRVMKMERWAVFAILSFILLIISFNIIGSLSMLVMEKKQDIFILKALGASPAMVRAVFLLEGLLSGWIGAGVGVLLGAAFCLLQQKTGFLKLTGGENSFVVQAYPVVMKWSDFVLAVITVTLISLAAAWFPARRAAASTQVFK
ncbi:MAG: FtsX-like permease family protein [Chitinophagales bacterium]